ncbi:MAG: hypothetical protein ACFFB4_03345 [Promethearchaeota archaeon]
MITHDAISEKGKLKSVVCRICYNNTGKKPQIVKLGTEFQVICNECTERFTPEERDLIYNMFTAFGGYFGKLKDESSYKVITRLMKEYNLEGADLKLSAIDVRVLHEALLYGIAPRHLIQGIKILQE